MTAKQTTIQKPAAKKTAPKSAPAAKKTSSKPAAKAAVKTAPAKTAAPKTDAVALDTRTLPKGGTLFVITDTARPGAGRALFAHTHAALSVLGMLTPQRPAVPRSMITTVMGQRALNYHLKEGNFEDTADHGIRLSSSGHSTFRERASTGRVDPKLANSFVSLLLENKVAGTGVAAAQVYQFKA